MATRVFRRRNFLIHPTYQLASAITAIFYILCYSLLLGFLIFFPIQRELHTVADTQAQLELAQQILRLHGRVWPSILVIALLVGIHAVLNTHRTVGPLFRLQETLRAYGRGEFGLRMRFRRRDWFRELEACINDLGASLQERWARREAQREKVAKGVEHLARHLAARGTLDEEGGRLLAQVRDALKTLRGEGGERESGGDRLCA